VVLALFVVSAASSVQVVTVNAPKGELVGQEARLETAQVRQYSWLEIISIMFLAPLTIAALSYVLVRRAV
jgi:hypothetical protein